MAEKPDIVHVAMGGGIVLAAYRRADLAMMHARCITGASAVPLDLNGIAPDLRACIEVLDRLPPEIAADLDVEWEDDDVTPEIVDDVDVSIDDIDER